MKRTTKASKTEASGAFMKLMKFCIICHLWLGFDLLTWYKICVLCSAFYSCFQTETCEANYESWYDFFVFVSMNGDSDSWGTFKGLHFEVNYMTNFTGNWEKLVKKLFQLPSLVKLTSYIVTLNWFLAIRSGKAAAQSNSVILGE